ncbi:MAG: hypothetical protein ACE5I9_07710 [Candidatus Methylomirabilales bacterium]
MTKQQRRPFQMKRARLKPAQSAFGLASHPYKIELNPSHDELVQVEIPLDLDLCAKREVNPATIRVFRWNEGAERFLVVEGSRVDERWKSALARIFESGVYIAAGASSNPWVGNAVATLRLFRPLLHRPDIGPILRHRLCPVILCPNMLGEIFEEIGDPAQHGLPPLPPRDLCDICLGGWLGHAVDLYPEPRIPPPPGGLRCEPCDLNAYLECHPHVRRAIIWRDPLPRRYDAWSTTAKADLAAAFDTIRAGGEVGLPETAPATAPVPGALLTRLSADDAWQAFIAHLAQTLVVDSCGWVDWSILGYSTDELRLLLDSDAMFTAAVDGYEMHLFPHGHASHGDPTRVYQWLRSEGLVASDQLTTVGRVLEWCRDNMAHYLYGPTPDNMEAHWQYRGFPPVERIIAGTTSPYGTRHWTAGCWGTSGFLRLVLRTINLPATFVTNCGHAQPYFPTLGRYLSHGDDPYNRNTRDAGAAGTDLLLDQATFDAWFGPAVPDRCDNIGRRPRELAGEE